jgi:uncharacterized membrane protein YecN with MAPEG domain
MITGFYAALLGLMFLGLTHYVIAGRKTYKTALGDGGQADLATRIRIHGNFAENIPFALLLVMLVEMQGAPLLSIHAMGLILIIGRVFHGYALHKNILLWRVVGMVLTHIVMGSCCAFLIWKFITQAS